MFILFSSNAENDTDTYNNGDSTEIELTASINIVTTGYVINNMGYCVWGYVECEEPEGYVYKGYVYMKIVCTCRGRYAGYTCVQLYIYIQNRVGQ